MNSRLNNCNRFDRCIVRIVIEKYDFSMRPKREITGFDNKYYFNSPGILKFKHKNLSTTDERHISIHIAAVAHMEWSCHHLSRLNCDVGGCQRQYELCLGFIGLVFVCHFVDECDKSV